MLYIKKLFILKKKQYVVTTYVLVQITGLSFQTSQLLSRAKHGDKQSKTRICFVSALLTIIFGETFYETINFKPY